MRAFGFLALLLAGCGDSSYTADYPCTEPLGARGVIGCRLAVGRQPELDGKYTGFLVASDKPGHYGIGWIDSLGSGAVFSGVVTVDGAIDPGGTHGHIGNEAIRFDSASQLSFQSAPGDDLAGLDLTTDSPVLYLDGYLNGSRLAFAARIETQDQSGCAYQYDADLDPLAFAPAPPPAN